MVADVLKSFTIYYIKYDPNAKSIISKNHFVRNGGVKLRFPYGQWCTSMEKITDQLEQQEVFASSFFDHNFAILSDAPHQFLYNHDAYQSPLIDQLPTSNLQKPLTPISACNMPFQIT